jgi:hypothetical protein
VHRELRRTFGGAHYRVTTPRGDLLLRVDQRHPGLASLLEESDVSQAALLTAFNPGARRAAPFRNRRAQRQLREEIARRGYRTLAGRNEDPRGRWPVEPTLLVLGLPLQVARRLAAGHGQVAFLWIRSDGTPRLVETAALCRY